MDDVRIKEKIRKLIQMTKSANQHEAAIAAAKVQQMLSEHNLTMEVVQLNTATMCAQESKCKTRQALEDWAYILAGKTSKAFDCDFYHDRSFGYTVFIGVGVDSEICSWMYGYLYKTLLKLASEHLRSKECRRLRAKKSIYAAGEAFLRGAVSIIADRLQNQKKDSPVTPGTLVISKSSIIKEAMPPDLRTKKISTHSLMREGDWFAGRQSGAGVSLSTPISNTGKSNIALN